MGREKAYSPSLQRVDLGPNDQNVTPLAEDVAIDRATMVTETMFHIAAIRSLQGSRSTGSGAPVQCVRAGVQDTTAQYGQQAAHLLPGSILVGGIPVWQLARVHPGSSASPQEVLRVALDTQTCFAKTNVLPAAFNRADSQAESSSSARGLKGLFGNAVGGLWRSARVLDDRPLVIDRAAVFAALQVWFDSISALYEQAAASKRAAAATSANTDDRTLEARVLEVYARSFQVANVGRFAYARAPQVVQRYRTL